MSTVVGTLKDYEGNDFLPVTDVSLVSGLEDINTIRSGAALGATSVQDVTVGGTSIVSSGVASIQTMTTNELNTLWESI